MDEQRGHQIINDVTQNLAFFDPPLFVGLTLLPAVLEPLKMTSRWLGPHFYIHCVLELSASDYVQRNNLTSTQFFLERVPLLGRFPP